MKIRLFMFNYRSLPFQRTLNTGCKYYSSKIPKNPVVPLEKENEMKVNLGSDTIALLERLSLVKCDTAEGIEVLEESITFANRILQIDTEGVKPLYTVLENEHLHLRSDNVTQGNCQKDILKNAAITEEDYFVAPPGNIPLNDINEDQTQVDPKCKAKSTKSSN